MPFIRSLFGKTITKRKTVSDVEIDMSPPKIEKNALYVRTDFYRCKFNHTEMWPYSFHECRFFNCEFELRKKGLVHRYPNCGFENCVFTFISASRIMFNSGQEFRNCAFKGTLKDSVFALNPNGEYSKGCLHDCNFEQLKFDLLDFRGDSLSEDISFSGWPIVCFHRGPTASKDFDKDYIPVELKHFDLGYRRRDSGFMAINVEKMLTVDSEKLWAALYDAPFLKFSNISEKALPDPDLTKKVRAFNKRSNEIIRKYQGVFQRLMLEKVSIQKIVKRNNDLVLSIAGTNLDEEETKYNADIILMNYTKAIFIGGQNDGYAIGYDGKFSLRGIDIDHENDAVTLSGPRKSMGKLHLTFSESVMEKL